MAYRTAGEIITAALRIYGSSGGTAWSNAEQRYRAEWALNQVATKAVNCSPNWSRTTDSTTQTMSAGNGYVALPSDFDSTGDQMQVFVTGQKTPMIYMAQDQLMALREANSTTATTPVYYTLHLREGASGFIYTYPINTASCPLTFYNYVRITPEMIDCPTAPTVAAGAAGSVTAGAHLYKITYEWDSADRYTEGGIASLSITASGSTKIELTDISTTQSRTMDIRKVWRTKAGAQTYYLLGSITDNVTTTYSDNAADAALVTAMPAISTTFTGAEEFPANYHYSVLYEGLVAQLGYHFGDMRADKFWEEWTRNVRKMWAEGQSSQNALQAMPRYRGNRRGYRVPRNLLG